MRKAKKTKVPAQKTALDRITAQLRTVLRRETTNIILIGNLLIEARKHLDHGEWQPYLAENFDLSIRTAQNYFAAAEYVARKKQIGNVADFANLSASVLYHLAAGHFDERVEAAILAEARERRVDEDAAWAIDEKLAPPDDDDTDDADDQEDGEDRHDSGDEKDAESEAILDGPPPAVPPPAPNPPPTDFALRDFDQAISALKRLMTKPSTQFARTIHSADDLEGVESFIHTVMRARRQ